MEVHKSIVEGTTMKAKNLVVSLLAITALSMALAPTAVFAGPPTTPNYGVVDPVKITNLPPEWMYDVEKIIPAFKAPGGQIHIVTDGLAATPDGGSATGTVVFWCQSTVGFQYNIVTSGLDVLSRYTVDGSGIRAQPTEAPPNADPGNPGTWPPNVFFVEGTWFQVVNLVQLDLGTFRTDANGLGGVKGTIKLDAGYLYDISVVVSDADGTPVLVPAIEGELPDTTGFMVY
jgi:hypothetical protein